MAVRQAEVFYAAGDRPLDAVKMQCLWDLVMDPEHATIAAAVSTVLYGDSAAHNSGHVTQVSSGRGCRNDEFATNSNYIPLYAPDPNNERSFDEAKENLPAKLAALLRDYSSPLATFLARRGGGTLLYTCSSPSSLGRSWWNSIPTASTLRYAAH